MFLLPFSEFNMLRHKGILRTMLTSVMIVMIFGRMLIFDPGGGILIINQRMGWVENVRTRIILEPDICGSEDVAVIIHSHANNSLIRSSQRKALKENNLKPVFVVFKSDSVKTEKLEEESLLYADLLVGEMQESYYNLIYKHVMALRWMNNNCPDNIVIKMDDDIYVNFPSMLEVVNKNIPDHNPDWMMGLLQLRLPVLRSETASKWSVSHQDWSEDVYPDFLSGWCYIASSSAVRNIVLQMEAEDSLFWIDDVMITGVVADRAGVERISLNSYFTVHKKIMDCCTEATDEEECGYLVGPTDGNIALLDSLVRKQKVCRRTESCKAASKCTIQNPFFSLQTAVGEVIPV